MEITRCYTALGLSLGASRAEIKQAYKALALKYHPDLNPAPDAARRFQQINQAHAILRDHPAPTPNTVREPSTGQDNFQSLLASLQPIPTTPASTVPRATLAISLEEASAGIDRLVTLNITDSDHQGRPLTVTRQQRISLPAGLREGQWVQLAGTKHQSPLQLKILYKPHPLFHGDGPDLHLKLPVSQALASSGGQLKVPTLSGQAIVQVPAKTCNGEKVRLLGRGLGGPLNGDLIVTLYIETASARGRSACAMYRRTAHQGFRRDPATLI